MKLVSPAGASVRVEDQSIQGDDALRSILSPVHFSSEHKRLADSLSALDGKDMTDS